jgi:phosphatidylinositol alpha-mannosyltransferase
MSIAFAPDRAPFSFRLPPFGQMTVVTPGRPLRICQVVPYDLDENGGVKHHAVQLARALRAKGDEVTIVGPSVGATVGSQVRGFKGVFNIPSNGSANRIGLFTSFAEVWRFFRASRFDVVQVHEPVVPMLACWAILSSPGSARVATFHSFAERPSRALTAFARVFAATQAPAYHAATAVSEPASAFAGMLWRQPRTIVPNGVSMEAFTPPDGPRLPGPTRLLFVGRLGDKRKGFDQMLGAYRTLRARGVNLVLDVVGELGGAAPPPAVPGLTYHGALPLDALAERYRRCDLFVAPSTGQESFGIVLLEAMASARPIVCSDIVGYRGTVAPSGTRLVAPNSAAALADAIAELAARPEVWPAMGQANLKRARGFSWDDIARRTRSVYLEAISARIAKRTPRRHSARGRLEDVDRRQPAALRASDHASGSESD